MAGDPKIKLTYRDLFVQGKTQIYAAWTDLEDALRRACEYEERGDYGSKLVALEQAVTHARSLGAAAMAAVRRMRTEE